MPKLVIQVVETAGIKFPDMKTSGVFVRSQKMKLPANVGQKKMKAIEQMLQELNIGKFLEFKCDYVFACQEDNKIPNSKKIPG